MTSVTLDSLMNTINWKFWQFVPLQPPDDEVQIKCPICKEWSPCLDWREGEVGCEDCGSHATLICPKCEEGFDHVSSEPFETRLFEINPKEYDPHLDDPQ
jgi:hypothetical protein